MALDDNRGGVFTPTRTRAEDDQVTSLILQRKEKEGSFVFQVDASSWACMMHSIMARRKGRHGIARIIASNVLA